MNSQSLPDLAHQRAVLLPLFSIRDQHLLVTFVEFTVSFRPILQETTVKLLNSINQGNSQSNLLNVQGSGPVQQRSTVLQHLIDLIEGSDKVLDLSQKVVFEPSLIVLIVGLAGCSLGAELKDTVDAALNRLEIFVILINFYEFFDFNLKIVADLLVFQQLGTYLFIALE